MSPRTALIAAAVVAVVNANHYAHLTNSSGSCYTGGDVTCDTTESYCTYALGGTYYAPGYASSYSGCCHCAASCADVSDDTCTYYDAPISAGSCYASGVVTCDVAEADCTGSFYDVGFVSSYSGCCHCMAGCDGATSDDGCAYPDKPITDPLPPPAPPAPPPAPPQLCITAEGTDMAKQAAPADPVNEPCYTHSSCKGYVPGTGPVDTGGYICCVTVGTCDSGYVSNSARYYEGGCTGVNYAANSTMIASASTSDDFPSTIDGCVKQGECNLPFLEQIKHWTATGGGLTTETVPDDVMDRLLVGATESYADACRDASLYPRTTVTATHFAALSVTVEQDISSLTQSVLEAMEAKVAQNMGVAAGNVDITAAAGSVVLSISIGYDDADEATAAATTLSTVMATADDATAMLTTSALTVVATTVATPVSGAGSAAPSPPSPPPPPSPPSSFWDVAVDGDDDGLAVGVIAGIAVGGSVVVIAIIVGVMMAMQKKKKVSPVKTVPAPAGPA